jgi:hypothetical protein
MRHIAICGLLHQKYFSTLSHKRYNYKKITDTKYLLFTFSSIFVCNTLTLERAEWDVITNVQRNITQISNFTGIRRFGSRVVPCRRTDGQSEMTKRTVTVRNFAMRLKIPAVYLKRTEWADCIWICRVRHVVLCWNWQHSAGCSNWNRLTATFTVTH